MNGIVSLISNVVGCIPGHYSSELILSLWSFSVGLNAFNNNCRVSARIENVGEGRPLLCSPCPISIHSIPLFFVHRRKHETGLLCSTTLDLFAKGSGRNKVSVALCRQFGRVLG